MNRHWLKYIKQQQAICNKLGADFVDANPELHIGLADNVKAGGTLIHGLRHPQENGTTGWFIWADDYSEADDFFKPVCLKHLIEIKPSVIKYLGLPPGYRFLIDNDGYEDIWLDEKIQLI